MVDWNGGGTEISLAVGGSGGTGGIGNTVNVENTGTVYTLGSGAVGIVAQSVGGGGGDGSTVVVGATSLKVQANKISVGIGGAGGPAVPVEP